MKKLGFSMAALVAAGTATTAFGALYSEDFNVDNTVNWTVNGSGTDVIADFFYDYSAIGVPSANGSDTTGLKMTANNTSGVFGGFSVSPNGQSFTGNYKVSFDLWQNYAGPVGPGGSGTTQLSTMGFGTDGTSAAWPGASPQDQVFFGVTLDGGSSVDYRVYSSAFPTGHPEGDAVFASGGPRNGSDIFYTTAFPGGQAAPAAQVALFPGQTGVTDAGEIGFAWRKVEIEVLGSIATWKIDGVLLATIDSSNLTLAGNNILFGHSDTNGGSSTDPNDTLLNVTLIDNVVVTPEPASLALLGLGAIAMFRRR